MRCRKWAAMRRALVWRNRVIGRALSPPTRHFGDAGGSVGTATFLATWWAAETVVHDPGSLPGGPFAAWLALWLSALPWPLVLVAPLVLFPDGRVRTRRWFWFATVFGVIIGILTAVAAIVSLPVAARHAVELLDAPGITGTPAAEFAIGLPAIARLITFVATLIALIGLAVARHGVNGDDRRPFTTVLVGAAVVRFQLYDLRTLVNRSVGVFGRSGG